MPTRSRRIGSLLFIVLGIVLAATTWYFATSMTANTHRAKQITDNAPAGIVICSPEGKMVYANPSISRMTGYTHDELLSGGVNLLIPDEYQTRHHDSLTKATELWKQGQSVTDPKKVRQLAVRCKDGSSFQANIRLSSIQHGTNNIEFIAFITYNMIPQESIPATEILPAPPNPTTGSP